MQYNRTVWRKSMLVSVLSVVLLTATGRAAVIDFEDLPVAGSPLPAGNPGTQWYGATVYNDPPTPSSFASGGVTFHNTRQYFHSSWPPPNGSDMDFWEGWAYSNRCDTTAAGLSGQFTAMSSGVAGSNGANSSAQYAVAYPIAYNGTDTGINFSQDTTVQYAYFTNIAYAYDIMKNGDPNNWARQFQVGDWFMLTITGVDSYGATLPNPVEFYLADFRSTNPAEDYIVKDWTKVDLTALGDKVRSLEFVLTSSDSGDYGSNTPTYFAMDNLTIVPEPSMLAMIVAGGVAAIAWCWRRRQS
jgi:hypothetical protein